MVIVAEDSLVSVVIPTFNYGHLVADAVQSALAQSWRDLEVIVVDDGSTDDTAAVLSTFQDRIQVVRQANAGLSAARNKGIGLARGAYVAILDADDVWLPEKIERQLDVFAAFPDTGVVSCATILVDAGFSPLTHLPAGEVGDPATLRQRLAFGNVVSGGSAALIRRDCLDAVGPFDETLRSAEDWDMWLRISRRYAIRFLPEALVQVRTTGANMSGVRHADRMLSSELQVVDKLAREDPGLLAEVGGICAVQGHRYFCAAWANWQAGDLPRARRQIWRALRLAPSAFLKPSHAGLLGRITAGLRPRR